MPAPPSAWKSHPGSYRAAECPRFSQTSKRSPFPSHRSQKKTTSDPEGASFKKPFVWSPSYVDALVTRDRDTDANGTLDERLYAQHDANFNVAAITNTGGTVQERYTPDPFGVGTFRDASGNTISACAEDWVVLHRGGQAEILGHYDFPNMILSPTLGRWLTNDPLGLDPGTIIFIDMWRMARGMDWIRWDCKRVIPHQEIIRFGVVYYRQAFLGLFFKLGFAGDMFSMILVKLVKPTLLIHVSQDRQSRVI